MNILFWVTTTILLFAIWGSANLSRYDMRRKDICPKIAGIPACYIVFIFFIAAGISYFINSSTATYAFFILIAVPALIALVGTITELRGKVICPRTKSGAPMCYISLGMCVVIFITKYFSL